jgi:hypothetical protein
MMDVDCIEETQIILQRYEKKANVQKNIQKVLAVIAYMHFFVVIL